MEAVALRGRLLPGAHEQYKRAHDDIPLDLLAAQRQAGIRRWTVFTDGPDLFHYAGCESFDEAMYRPAKDPVDQSWQRDMAQYKRPVDESGATERRLKLIYARDLLH